MRGGRKTGHNTDWHGFYTGFDLALPGANKRSVVQLGAGGAGSAVAYAALKLGIEQLVLFDLDISRAEQLASNLNKHFGRSRVKVTSDISNAMRCADGLIQCTPVGMDSLPGMPIQQELLRPELWLYDIIYFPLETELMRFARRLGCRVAGGESMVIGQAIEQIRLFTGLKADRKRMLAHFKNWEASSSER
jgi:shikimate dehydrogenase